MANFGLYVEKPISTREVTRDRLALINRIEDFVDAIRRWSDAYPEKWQRIRANKQGGFVRVTTVVAHDHKQSWRGYKGNQVYGFVLCPLDWQTGNNCH